MVELKKQRAPAICSSVRLSQLHLSHTENESCSSKSGNVNLLHHIGIDGMAIFLLPPSTASSYGHLAVRLLVVLLLVYGGSTYIIPEEATDPEAEVIDQFYFPTDQGLAEFREILLRGLGLRRVPDLSKINITREEYDEFRRFEPPSSDDDSAETRHVVILNHGQVKSSSRRRDVVEWRLRFRHPSDSEADGADPLLWEAESPRPLQLHLTGPNGRQSVSRFSLQVDNQSVVFPQDFEEDAVGGGMTVRLNPASLSDYLLDQSLGRVYRLPVRCVGQDCPLLRSWRLSAQLRLISTTTKRIKRHAATVKRPSHKQHRRHHHSRRSKSGPQPGDILANKHKSSGRSHECGKKSNGGGKKCCPHSLKINFRQLPGFDWILEPKEIDIFMCKGDCHYNQFSHNPANNHALFQGYLHTIDKRLVPKLCCTPSKLDSVQIIHYDQDDPTKLTTTKWEGAVVKECACA